MGAIGYSLAVTGGGDVPALRAGIWQEARRFAGAYTGGPAYQEVHEYLDNNDACDERDPAALRWWFKDLAGCCTRSAGAWLHWLHLTVAVEWDRIVRLATTHGVTITAPRPSWDARRERFVVLHGYLWSADSDALSGDDRHLPLAALTDPERSSYDRSRHECRCGVCDLLRPDPGAQVVQRAAQRAGESAAAWFLARMDAPDPQILTEMLTAGVDSFAAMTEPVERYARRLPGAWEHVLALLPSLTTDDSRDLALYALAALADGRSPADRAAYTAALRVAEEQGSDTAFDLLRR